MRIAIISDIHEDFRMLEKAFGEIRHSGYDLLVCLGDVTGFAHQFYDHPPDANACIDLLRQQSHIALAGNHDLFTSRRLPSYHAEKHMPINWYELSLNEQIALTGKRLWLYEDEVMPVLSAENAEFLQKLPEWQVVDTGTLKILFSHFVKPDLAGVGRWFPWQSGELRPHFGFMEELDCRLAFAGHCHPDGLSLVSRHYWSDPCYESATIKQRPRIALCPAIVNSKSAAGFIIFDTKTGLITPHPLN